MAGAWRAKVGLSPARVGVGGAARENVFRSSARGFTNRGAETGNVHAKPRRIQPRESENSERSTRRENWR